MREEQNPAAATPPTGDYAHWGGDDPFSSRVSFARPVEPENRSDEGVALRWAPHGDREVVYRPFRRRCMQSIPLMGFYSSIEFCDRTRILTSVPPACLQ